MSGIANSGFMSTTAFKDTILVGKTEIKIANKISEGGYAVVYKALEANTGQVLALKKIFLKDKDTEKQMKKEVKIWRMISGHPNIVKFIDATIRKSHNGDYLYILSDYCKDGHILDLLEKYHPLSESQIIKIMLQITEGILHMHSQQPPIAHRDIKVENILKDGSKFKLCDFGSASEEFIDPRQATNDELEDAFEEYEKYTTFMYRPPEMQDKYSNWQIGLKVDSWMLGCVLFALCYSQHPFQDAQKLAIINSHFFIPEGEGDRVGEKLKDLIWHILTPNPAKRPSIHHIYKILESWDEIDTIPMNSEGLKNKQAYIKRMHSMDTKRSKVPLPSGELTEDEIAQIQKRIMQAQEKKKMKHFVPLYDDYGAKLNQELYNQKPKAKKVQQVRKQSSAVEHYRRNNLGKQKPVQKHNCWDDFGDETKPKSKPSHIQQAAKPKDHFEFDFDQQQPQKRKANRHNEQFDYDFDNFGNEDNRKAPKQQKGNKNDDWFGDFEAKPKRKQPDAFDFDDFEAPKQRKQSRPEPVKRAKPTSNEFDFDAFESGRPAQNKKSHKVSNQFDFDDFESNSRAPPKRKQPTSNEFDFDDFESRPVKKPNKGYFDDFGDSPKHQPKPVPKNAANLLDSDSEHSSQGANFDDFDYKKQNMTHKQAQNDEEDLLFGGDDDKISPDTDLLFSDKQEKESNWLFSDMDDNHTPNMDEDLIETKPKSSADFLFDDYTEAKSQPKETDLLSNLQKLYSDGGVVDKDEGILKPETPEVLKKQSKFVPEVHASGQQFWESLYGQAEPNPAPPKPQADPEPKSAPEVPKPDVFSSSGFEFQPSHLTHQTPYSTSQALPSYRKSQKDEPEKPKFGFTKMATSYLLQTNLKK